MKPPPLKPAEMDMVRVVFRLHPEIETVTLFGSRAKGAHSDRSDVDLVVTGDVAPLRAESIAAELDELTGALVTSKSADGAFDPAHWGQQGMQELTPLWLLKYLPNMLACHVTIIHDCQGPSNTITCNEASSGLSIAESQRVIERGAADACLSGGADSKINPMAYLRQELAGRFAACPAGTDPTGVIRPFAADATGTLIGEGGGILVLEAEETAKARGARIHAVLSGTGASQSFCEDTVGLVPDASGESLADAIERALADAGVAPTEIDAIIPYGSGVPDLDGLERNALARVFGDGLATKPIVTLAPSVGATIADLQVWDSPQKFTPQGEMAAERAAAVVDEGQGHPAILTA